MKIKQRIVEHKLIESAFDLMDLDIIDWSRSWTTKGDALNSISSWFINVAEYTIVECDIRQAPERSDFPDWHHVGNHDSIAHLWWNYFHWRYRGTLWLDDRPDFGGSITFENSRTCSFRGDFGKVSASSFSHAQKDLREHDLWISVLDETRQVLIEPYIDIHQWWMETVGLTPPDMLTKLVKAGLMHELPEYLTRDEISHE